MRARVTALLCALCFAGPAGAEIVSSADWWLSMPPATRYAYLDGYLDGRFWGIADLSQSLGASSTKAAAELHARTPSLVDRRALERQIDRLYRDPLNVYLPFGETAFIAGEQIKGKSMEAELKRLRPLAYERYRMAKQLGGDKR